MRLRSIRQIKNLQGKKVLLRVDFNVPLSDGKHPTISDDTRIVNSLPIIKYLIEKKAIIIIIFHVGRPNGKVISSLSVKPIAQRLEQLVKRQVVVAECCQGDKIKKVIEELAPGQIVMLENLRFHIEEKKGNVAFAKSLASLADIYVNDAFANSHRPHASMVTVTKFLPSYAGLLLEQEVKELSGLFKKPKKPIVSIIGGIKISSKLGVIKTLLKLSDSVLLGGALANTVLKAQNVSVGRSLVEEGMVKELRRLKLTDTHLHIPVDTIVSEKVAAKASAKVKAAGNITNREYILDIGPDTLKLYDCIIRGANTIIWSGPMGVFEIPKFSQGTEGVIHAILHSNAKVVIGGGETIEALKKLKSFMHFDRPNIYISTGGGAMLEFIEKKTLPAIKPLIIK